MNSQITNTVHSNAFSSSFPLNLLNQPNWNKEQESSSIGESLKGQQDKENLISVNQGRWTEEEHQRFEEGLSLFKKDWKMVEKHVGTRNGSQIRSHAQKYFNKMYRGKKMSSIQSYPMQNLIQREDFQRNEYWQDQKNLNNKCINDINALGGFESSQCTFAPLKLACRSNESIFYPSDHQKIESSLKNPQNQMKSESQQDIISQSTQIYQDENEKPASQNLSVNQIQKLVLQKGGSSENKMQILKESNLQNQTSSIMNIKDQLIPLITKRLNELLSQPQKVPSIPNQYPEVKPPVVNDLGNLKEEIKTENQTKFLQRKSSFAVFKKENENDSCTLLKIDQLKKKIYTNQSNNSQNSSLSVSTQSTSLLQSSNLFKDISLQNQSQQNIQNDKSRNQMHSQQQSKHSEQIFPPIQNKAQPQEEKINTQQISIQSLIILDAIHKLKAINQIPQFSSPVSGLIDQLLKQVSSGAI